MNGGAATEIDAPQVVAATTEDDDEDDEEKKVLIPSDTYDGLICAACVRGSAFIENRAGTEGWMMIEPRGDGTYEVVGGQEKEDESIPQAAVKERSDHANAKNGDDDIAVGKKRPAEEVMDENDAKKVKLEGDSQASSSVKAEEISQWKWKGKGDVFLAHGIRDGLKATLSVS